ncbi:MAG: OmpA family protein [Tannerella sp.]|jgi:peptidoglycan-associated lipoprotein|nr:OmpA family protein [Tannerella sp.]
MNVSFAKYLCAGMAICLLFGCKSAKLSDAENKQRMGEYYAAAEIYRKLYRKTKPSDKELRSYIAFRMGDCNRLTGNIPRAVSAYLNALRYEYPDSTLHLRLGQTYHRNGQYADAIEHYREYLMHVPNSAIALNGIIGCETAAQWKAQPTRYVVAGMEVLNSRRSEFCPMLYGEKYDQLFFNSTRGTVHKDSVNAITGMKNNALYSSKKDEQGNWQKPEEVTDAVASSFDEGTPSFSADRNTMYYTYCPDDAVDPRTAEIYISTRSGATWSKGQRAPIVKDSVTLLAHPAASPDGKYLYFVTDAVGGFGGKDLFRTRLIGINDFGGMENLGADINTEGDEMFPYVKDSVTLYFASNGHPGLGGLDIFKATLDSAGKWHVANMGVPINSNADDFGITFAGNREEGFFSSNRNDARGWDHIYSFTRPAVTIFIEGYVSDAEDNPVGNAAVHIVGKDGLNVKAPVKPDGSYRVELKRDISYVMMAAAPGFLNQNFELKTDAEEKNETYYVDFYLSPIDKPVVVENIFYAFDSAELRPESKEALDKLLKILNDNPHATIELGAHTDRKGADNYNERLALRRAQSVVDYLTAAGIDPARLTAKGYGKTVPKTITPGIAKTHDFLPEGAVLDEAFIETLTPEQQDVADQINRRTEFIVTGLDYNLR